jgi:hypothetical protein
MDWAQHGSDGLHENGAKCPNVTVLKLPNAKKLASDRFGYFLRFLRMGASEMPDFIANNPLKIAECSDDRR